MGDLGRECGACIGSPGVPPVRCRSDVYVTRKKDQGDVAGVCAKKAAELLDPGKDARIPMTRLGQRGGDSFLRCPIDTRLPLRELAFAA